jgi:hypothetical protein
VRLKELERLTMEAKRKTDRMQVSVPKGLAAKIKKAIKGTDQPWDLAVWTIAAGNKTQ